MEVEELSGAWNEIVAWIRSELNSSTLIHTGDLLQTSVPDSISKHIEKCSKLINLLTLSVIKTQLQSIRSVTMTFVETSQASFVSLVNSCSKLILSTQYIIHALNIDQSNTVPYSHGECNRCREYLALFYNEIGSYLKVHFGTQVETRSITRELIDLLESDFNENSTKVRENIQILQWIGFQSNVQNAVYEMMCKQIDVRLINRRNDDEEETEKESITEELKKLFNVRIKVYLDRILVDSKSRSLMCRQIDFYIGESIARERISSLFDLIVDFPSSKGLLFDLYHAMSKVCMESELVSSMQTALMSRLLHYGAQTSDIIDQYINMIQAFAIFDRSGVLLSKVSPQLHYYLRNRSDAIRCIMTKLSESEAESDSNNVLLRNFTLSKNSGDEQHTDLVQRDILSTFVSIYGSRELFVSEYKSLLCDKLMNVLSYDFVKEMRNLETFKLRFGESNMQPCSIMLRDVSDSQRMLNGIRNGEKAGADAMDVLVLSYMFWPESVSESVKNGVAAVEETEKEDDGGCSVKDLSWIPMKYRDQVTEFTTEYEKQKLPRKLRWHSDLGTVLVSIEFQDHRVVQIQASPRAVSVLEVFSDDDDDGRRVLQLSVEEIAKKMNVGESCYGIIRGEIGFWIRNAVLRKVEQVEDGIERYEVIENEDEFVGEGVGVDQEASDERTGENEATKKSDEMEIYSSYIFGMLQNFDALPLERIHQMLKMFVVNPPFDKTQRQLFSFLEELVVEEKLVFSQGQYSVK